jgi:hypothetical protein
VSTPPGFPTSSLEVWTGWLEYRIPHWDALERAAAGTLTRSKNAKVRVDWNGQTGAAAEWHATLFTLTAETPDPTGTIAAAREYKRAGVLLHHVVSDMPHVDAAAPLDPRAAGVAALVAEALEARRALAEFEDDVRSPAVARERFRQTAEALVDRARAEVEQAISDGLHARVGFHLVPTMIVKPEMIRDWLLYGVALAFRTALAPSGGDPAPWRPRGIAVCRACTAVFVPRRRATGEFCHLCSKRPAEPFVIGQRPIEPGSPQTVRTPKLAGNVIVGWATTTIGLCPDCGAPFHGRRDAIACPDCTNRARQRRHRESRANAAR